KAACNAACGPVRRLCLVDAPCARAHCAAIPGGTARVLGGSRPVGGHVQNPLLIQCGGGSTSLNARADVERMTMISPRSRSPVGRLERKEPSAMPREVRLALYRSMLKIRRVEERIKALYPEGDMRCPTHFSIGQEAVAAGVCRHLSLEDHVISAHRSHAHYIGKGGSLRAMFAELYGKVDGCASGKGGSMHLIDLSVNFLGCVPIVGSTIPIGVGASFGTMLQGRPGITVVFFGDAATETGVFHESVNFAAVHRLPVLFVCENNLYSVNTPLDARQPGNRTITELVRGHGIRTSQHDGQLVETVDAAAAETIAHIRNKGGPAPLEVMPYRSLEHSG